MAAATSAQMQTYADGRIRVRAAQFQALINGFRDDKALIDDVYARAAGITAWADARTDGPPRLLQAGNSANPDDFLNFNAFISALLSIIDGQGTDATNAATIRANWPVLNHACVKPL